MFINILKIMKITKQQMVVFETTKSQSRSVFFQLPKYSITMVLSGTRRVLDRSLGGLHLVVL